MLFVGKRCPKCGGNLYLDSDFHGYYEQCLQCAYVHDSTDANEAENVKSKTTSLSRIIYN